MHHKPLHPGANNGNSASVRLLPKRSKSTPLPKRIEKIHAIQRRMHMPNPAFELKDVVTVSIASVGAVLGHLNTWRAIDRDRPKLRVTPAHAIPFGGVDPRLTFCVEIINLGAIPLTVTEVGVFYSGTTQRSTMMPVMLDGGSLPRLLEPRTSISVLARKEDISPPGHRIRSAFAATACGLTFKGTSVALRQIASETYRRT